MENNTIRGYQKHIKLVSKFKNEGYVVGNVIVCILFFNLLLHLHNYDQNTIFQIFFSFLHRE